jgi:hypothetical protein
MLALIFTTFDNPVPLNKWVFIAIVAGLHPKV